MCKAGCENHFQVQLYIGWAKVTPINKSAY